ncbi:hypothetical protein KDL01_38570 [Actinospica durhamensis]|uniref:Uncharacterized protein n=1 Tax=Actinospica durhamensis TaxID=1508375 RepID=A0A941IWE6_9ACTN|nr:hypothetical protein [Actinospica durhamensis]MBR7839231.1 hypothetical protein [Actinospica durhamensis]
MVDVEPFCWCMVANVAELTEHQDAGLELQRGLKHFSPSTKLWVLPERGRGYGTGQLVTIGRHRGSSRYIRIVVARRHLQRFRAQGVYSPAVYRSMQYMPLWPTRDEIERQALEWNTYPLEARFDDSKTVVMVTTPPPLDLDRDGHRYYLARLNGRRVSNSSLPPPTEPVL